MNKNFVYTGAWLEESGKSCGGIRLFQQNKNGNLELIKQYIDSVAAGYICISKDSHYLYTVDEIKRKPGQIETSGTIYAFRINQNDGTLTEINHISSCGVFPNYLALSSDGSNLFAVNYGSEDITVRSCCDKDGNYILENIFEESNMISISIGKDGALKKIVDLRKFEGEPSRYFEWFQSSPHPHCIGIDPTNRMILVADRGCDEIVTCNYKADNGQFLNFHTTKTEDGIGPRNCIFHPNLPYVYVVGEVKPYVMCYEYDAANARIKLCSTHLSASIDAVYDKKNIFFDCAHPSDIQIHPNGKMLYVLNRGPDTIACFKISEVSGELELVEQVSTSGVWPWSCTIDGDGKYMYVGNKNSNNVVTFWIDEDGIPQYQDEICGIERTVCLKSLEV